MRTKLYAGQRLRAKRIDRAVKREQQPARQNRRSPGQTLIDYWRGRYEALKFNTEQVAGEMETMARLKGISREERRLWAMMANRLRKAAE